MPEVEPEEESQLDERSENGPDEGSDQVEASADEAPDEPISEDEAPADEKPGPRLVRAENPSDEDGEDEEEPEEDGRRRRPWAQHRVEATVEAMLFASPDVLGFRQIRSILPDETVSNEAIRAALKALQERYTAKTSGIMLVEISGGYQIQSQEEHFEYVQSLAKTRIEEKITQAALETLSIIAYKQPITRAEVDAIRGVGSGQLVRTLMDKKMVKVVGRVDLPGRPFQYGTTKQFLDHFGLKGLKDLPRGKDL